ncbi:FecCD family ABC transporter permease [Microbacterium sp. CFBP9034]|uniref:FecCD family ABC transporter permease n=1 Tax=Microbacterium sp. CFBP9034 TaxID=3096540 RepID=UPI002A6B67C8|nr:iron chelate uptake ABC transporter family permease subunit [Microbacterium sp. CFBP9034]MDY0909889.1 iron chelate uptake ABC transporter family permease subunit [Microbacterium sp. CFBP9034]
MTSSVLEIRSRVGRRRTLVVTAALIGALAIAIVSLSVGDYPIALPDLWRTLWGGGDRAQSYVVFQVRAPRLAMALLVGASLGAAGALLQSLLGNPLASPDLLGISGGAGAAAVFAILVLGTSGPLLAIAAFAGGLVVAAFLLLAGRHRADGGYRLILAGVGVAFLCVAVTNYLMVRAQVELAQSALIWLTGSLASTPWWNVVTVLVVAIAASPFVFASARWLPLTQMGAPTAASLGVRFSIVRLVTVLTAVLLTAVTCAFVGPIAFIALCAPAIARPLLGHGAIGIGTSAVIGAVLLAASDLVAQFALPGLSVPVGVVTGAVGAVFLLWLLATSKGRHL